MSYIAGFVPIIVVLAWLIMNKRAPFHFGRWAWLVLILGLLSTIFASVIGILAEYPFDWLEKSSPVWYSLVDNVLLTGIVEETGKFLAVFIGTWGMSKMRYSVDLIPYGIIAASGFSLLENIMYILDDGGSMSMGMLRGLTSSPMHMVYTLTVMLFYLRYKQTRKIFYIPLGIIFAGFIHGFSNFCLTYTTDSDITFSYIYLLLVLPAVMIITYMLLVSFLKSYRKSVLTLNM